MHDHDISRHNKVRSPRIPITLLFLWYENDPFSIEKKYRQNKKMWKKEVRLKACVNEITIDSSNNLDGDFNRIHHRVSIRVYRFKTYLHDES